MQQPDEQDIELLMLLNPGMRRAEALRQMARSAAGQELLRRRAVAGDRQAIAEYREDQRALARILAQAKAKVEAQLAVLRGVAEEGVLT